jgi:DNA-binding MarR family transcriptional regulator
MSSRNRLHGEAATRLTKAARKQCVLPSCGEVFYKRGLRSRRTMKTSLEKQSLAFLLNSSARFLNSAFEKRIAEAGLGLTPGEARALLTVAAIDGSKQADIASRIGLEPMTVCTYLDRLESLDLVERRPNPDDRRSKCIYLTDTSAQLLVAVRHEVDSLIGQATDGFSESDFSKFHDLLAILQKNLQIAVSDKNKQNPA